MEIIDKRIDGGKAFDWGRTSADYAKYRDIYPEEFYQKIVSRGLCTEGQNVLDLGTGTGVLPRNMFRFGAKWTGIDVSEEQIEQAEQMARAENMQIDFQTAAAEEIRFADESFDIVTACQCFWYFDHAKLSPILARILKPEGKLVVLFMAWLPYEDTIAKASEDLVLKYNPEWTGYGETKHPIHIRQAVLDYFEPVEHEEYDLSVPFTRESWHGRMRACRGVGASLNAEELAGWETEHRELLETIAPEKFSIHHYAAIAVLKKRVL